VLYSCPQRTANYQTLRRQVINAPKLGEPVVCCKQKGSGCSSNSLVGHHFFFLSIPFRMMQRKWKSLMRRQCFPFGVCFTYILCMTRNRVFNKLGHFHRHKFSSLCRERRSLISFGSAMPLSEQESCHYWDSYTARISTLSLFTQCLRWAM
jgi:hypothetical protein